MIGTFTMDGDPKTLTLLEVNARSMKPEMFQALVDNIKRDGALTQYPFVWYDTKNDARHVLSGNHRVRAAIAAGLTEITWIETADPLTEQQRTAIQISHNAITGEDDLSILATLFADLDTELQAYAAIDEATLKEMANAKVDVPHEDTPDIPEASEAFVKLSDLFGARAIPVEAAEVVHAAVARMLNRGEITEKAKWRAIELWAADYVAGE